MLQSRVFAGRFATLCRPRRRASRRRSDQELQIKKRLSRRCEGLFFRIIICGYFVKAFAAFNRPPDETRPSRFGSLSTEERSFSRNFATDRFGDFDKIKAATPATCGVAIDVPDAPR